MKRLMIPLLAFLAAAVLIAAPFVGMHDISPLDLFRGTLSDAAERIFWQIRLPRVLLAWIAGATLALCGMLFQALFRNPLASPDILGVTSGASFGAVLFIRLGALTGMGGSLFLSLSAGAFMGASLAVLTLLGCASLGRGLRDSTLLLAGVAINFLFASLTMIVQYTGDQFEAFRFMRWTLGGIQLVDFSEVRRALPVLLLIFGASLYSSMELDLMVCGDDMAVSRGVNVEKIRRRFFLLVSGAVGVVVALCGPIGFIGLMVPHICRLLVGGGHRYLTMATFLFGGTALVVCDTVARTFWAPVEMPVGILTSSCGAPFFLWLLLRKERGGVS